jgi:hypothetical protein
LGSYMFRSFRTIIRERKPYLAKVTVSVELSVKYIVKIVAVLWQYVLGAVRRVSHPAQHPVHTLPTEAHIATVQQQF